MKRTIATSFLFLIPVNVCFIYGDIFHLNLSVICLGLSVANHSHSFYTHTDEFRPVIIRALDMIMNSFNLLYTYYTALTSVCCSMYGTILVLIISLIYLKCLLHYTIENYTEIQRTTHAAWHIFVIVGMTHYKWNCNYNL